MGINNDPLVRVEIDGIEFKVNKGSKIIELADDVGVYIPRFCYHKKLSISANCRMCLVEIEKMPKLAPACATPVIDGMKIFTNTEKVIAAQRAVMEFLLINHPLDCPICDQGGECELQDLAVGYGCNSSRYLEDKRILNDYNFGPLVSTDITRCILCSRCVRFFSEIAGSEELGIIDRGSSSRIFTFLKRQLTSEISGNIIDLCPVGALTAKPSRFKARAWDLVQYPYISPHDCVGSNLFVHVYRDKIVRVVPRRADEINESWISDRDRFSYEGLYSDIRLTSPMIKLNGEWIKTSWAEALRYTSEKLLQVRNLYGANNLCSLASSNSTIEELYLIQKLLRSLGSNNLDHRLRQLDFDNQCDYPAFPGANFSVDEIDDSDCVIVFGSNITREQPIVGLKLRKIISNGGCVFSINSIDFDFFMTLTDKFIVSVREYINVLVSIINVYANKKSIDLSEYAIGVSLKNSNLNSRYECIVDKIINSKSKLLILGSFVTSSPDYSKILSLSILLSKISGIKLGIMTDGANSAGAWLAGVVPHRLPGGISASASAFGYNTSDMLRNNLKAYLLFGVDLELDSYYGSQALKALNASDLVVSFTSVKSEFLLNTSHVLLPIAAAYENSGTYVNVSGLWQTFTNVVPMSSDVKFGWSSIVDLAGSLNLPGIYYKNVDILLQEIRSYINKDLKCSFDYFKLNNLNSKISADLIINIPFVLPYKSDSLVRGSNSLHNIDIMSDSDYVLKCNENTYCKLKLKDKFVMLTKDNVNVDCNIKIDNSISDDCVILFGEYLSYKFPYKSIF